MKATTRIIPAIALAVVPALPTLAAAGEGSISLESNGLWRGQSQTSNGPTLRGKYDWTAKAWSYGIVVTNINTVKGGAEVDLHGAYSGGNDNAGWKVGYVYDDRSPPSSEVFLGGHYGLFSATYYYDLNSGGGYAEAAADIKAGSGKVTINYGSDVSGTTFGRYSGVSYGLVLGGYELGLAYNLHSVDGLVNTVSLGKKF